MEAIKIWKQHEGFSVYIAEWLSGWVLESDCSGTVQALPPTVWLCLSFLTPKAGIILLLTEL